MLPPTAHDVAGADAEAARLAARGVERVVVAVQTTAAWDERGIAPAALAKQYALVAEVPVAGWRVQVYQRPPADLTPHDVWFAAGFRLAANHAPALRLVGSDVMPIYLRWEGPAVAFRGSEKLTLQLLDAQGRLVAQTDQPFTATELAAPLTRYDLTLPRSSGDWRLSADPGAL